MSTRRRGARRVVLGQRQIFGQDQAAAGHDDEPLDAVLQLPDVAGPIIGEHALEGPPGDPDPPIVLPVVLAQEVLDQERDVLPTLSQGGQEDRHDVQTIVEILAEGSFLESRLQVPVGGGDDPDIHGQGPGAPHALEAALLQDAEQLDLQAHGQIADLVQEQAAPSASSKRPFLVAAAPVKAPFSWPNSSLSRSACGKAAQLMRINGPAARGEL
jgi:hypothetical protein